MAQVTAPTVVQQFDSLPGSALIDINAAIIISGRSRPSINRHFLANELTRVKIGSSTKIRVSELRRLIGVAPEAVAA